MARRFSALRPGVLLLALAIAVFLWGVANGTSSIELGFDIPVELHNTDEALVVTDQNVDSINVRVMGSRAALRNLSPNKLKYLIDVSGGKPGIADYEVDTSRVELPRSARIVSHSPSRVQVRFEERGRKVVAVRADLTGELPEGFELADVNVVPRRVWLSGARSRVLRMEEVKTDPIDLSGLQESVERDVRIHLGGGTVWLEEDKPVKVLLQVVPQAPLQGPPEEGTEGEAEGGEGPQGDAETKENSEKRERESG